VRSTCRAGCLPTSLCTSTRSDGVAGSDARSRTKDIPRLDPLTCPPDGGAGRGSRLASTARSAAAAHRFSAGDPLGGGALARSEGSLAPSASPSRRQPREPTANPRPLPGRGSGEVRVRVRPQGEAAPGGHARVPAPLQPHTFPRGRPVRLHDGRRGWSGPRAGAPPSRLGADRGSLFRAGRGVEPPGPPPVGEARRVLRLLDPERSAPEGEGGRHWGCPSPA